MERFLLIDNKPFFDNHNIITVENVNNIPNKSCIIFIGSHTKSLDNLNYVQLYLTHIKNKPFIYIIIVGKTDGILNSNIKIPNNVKYIYSMNINYTHPVIKFLPMGSDFRSISSFNKASIENNNRPILCYCNFSLNTHPDRKKIYNILQSKSFITFKHMQNFLNYSISRDEFFEDLGKAKFNICPRGNALDTFRFYDTIYSGCIPIVIKEVFHSLPMFKDIPILFLNNISDYEILTSDYLEEQYIELSKNKTTYYKGLDFKDFIDNIQLQLIKELESTSCLEA